MKQTLQTGTARPAWWHRLRWREVTVTVALLAFAVPLFLGLGRWDMRSDEAIYSYAVERILETGEWLTPRSLPSDDSFLEKPPLKFWLVAGAMVAGLTPSDESGMRFFDALFGVVGFAYIAAFGWRLAGPFCSIVALLVLYSFEPLIFDHGLRSNNMEAPLFLAYCGGLFHTVRWVEATTRVRHLHALAATLFFVLAFLTKFVAAAFLPLVALVWLPMAPDGLARLRRGWTEWIVPALVAVCLIVPWFVYQFAAEGAAFWETIFGQHVYVRLTSYLDPDHLAPWHFYFSETWRAFSAGGSGWWVLLGLVALLATALRTSPLSRLMLVWWLLPYGIISLGSSKLLHYAYPFIAPLALGAGLAVVLLVRLAGDLSRRVNWTRFTPRWASSRRARGALVVVAGVGLLLATWTHVSGRPITLVIDDVMVFRNGSEERPFVIALIALALAGYGRYAVLVTATALVLLTLPVSTYERTVATALRYDRPMSAAVGCMLRLQNEGRAPRTGVYISDWDLVAHPPYYYFRHVGEWSTGPDGWLDATVHRMTRDAPALVAQVEWPVLREALVDRGIELPMAVRVGFERHMLLLLPGAYSTCASEVVLFGGVPFRALAGGS